MKRIIVIIVLIFASLIFLTPSENPAHGNGHGGDHEGHEHQALPDLPTIPVEIRNESDVFVVLYLNSLCSPRIALRAGESKVIAGCFKRGLRYQGVVIFYTNSVILERLYIFLPVRPNHPWVFCKLPSGQETCDPD